MTYIILLAFIALFFLVKEKVKNKLSLILITVYLVWYGFWLVLSTFNIYGLYDVSILAYLYQLLGVIMLTLGFIIHPDRKASAERSYRIELHLLKLKSFKLFYFLFLLFVISAFTVYRNLILMGIADARNMFYTDKDLIFGNTYLGMIWSWIGYPYFYLLIIIFSINILNKRYFNPWVYLSLIFIFLYGYVGSGRGPFILILQVFIIVQLIDSKINIKSVTINAKKKIKSSIENKWVLAFLFITLIPSLGYTTAIRRGRFDVSFDNMIYGLELFFKQVVVYNIGPFRAFDYALMANYLGKIGFLYGKGALASIDYLIFSFFAMLGQRIFNASNNIINDYLQLQNIKIGYNQFLNYAYTQFLIFYLDFGVLGIVVFSFAMGFLFRKAINYYLESPNIFSFTLLIYFTVAVINSNFSYQLQSISAFFAISGFLYLSSRNKGSYSNK